MRLCSLLYIPLLVIMIGCGKPMVVRVAERAALSGASRIIVATDHEDIAAACRAHGVQVCMTRADHPSGTDRIAEAAAALGLAPEDIVVNVQGDEPLIAPVLIARVAAVTAYLLSLQKEGAMRAISRKDEPSQSTP